MCDTDMAEWYTIEINDIKTEFEETIENLTKIEETVKNIKIEIVDPNENQSPCGQCKCCQTQRVLKNKIFIDKGSQTNEFFFTDTGVQVDLGLSEKDAKTVPIQIGVTAVIDNISLVCTDGKAAFNKNRPIQITLKSSAENPRRNNKSGIIKSISSKLSKDEKFAKIGTAEHNQIEPSIQNTVVQHSKGKSIGSSNCDSYETHIMPDSNRMLQLDSWNDPEESVNDLLHHDHPYYKGNDRSDGENINICSYCGKKFMRKYSLKMHELVHTGEQRFVCEHCGKKFSSEPRLERHIRHHTGDRRYVCKTCGKSFVENSTRKVHIRIHTGERPFICETCGKGYRCSSNLRQHVRTHYTEKNYQCQICGLKLKTNTTLNNHVKNFHSDPQKKRYRDQIVDRPFPCEICGKRFTQACVLQRHSYVHTGEKPYVCKICDKGFFQRTSLIMHNQKHQNTQKNGTIA